MLKNRQKPHKVRKNLDNYTQTLYNYYRVFAKAETDSGREHFRRSIMNKTELVAAIAKETELSKKDAEAAVKAFVDVVANELKKGEKVQLVGFGTFEVSERAAREGRNPQTGETMTIEASKAPKFKAGKALKDIVNEK